MKYWIGFIACSKTGRRGWCITLGCDKGDALENAKAVFRGNGYIGGDVDVWHINNIVGFYQEAPWEMRGDD